MNTTNHTSPIGEDAANGAIGEREAFEAEMRTMGRSIAKDYDGKQYENGYTNVAWSAWQARATLPAEKVTQAEPVDYDGVVSICDAHGIGLPVDCIEMVVEIIRHAAPADSAPAPAKQQACTCGDGLGHSRTCAMFDESMMRYNPFGRAEQQAATLSDEQISSIAEKFAEKWSTSSAWNTRRCIDNALREARSLLAASAGQTEPFEKIARAIHYPACWDTAAYPTIESAIRETMAAHKIVCSECAPTEQTAAVRDVLAERERHVTVEGWTPEHDDKHTDGSLAVAGACYALVDARDTIGGAWPWDFRWWKPTTQRRNLIKAAALILAEIERIDRAAAKGSGDDDRN